MPMANPGRSCMAKRTALACSQALPAMGRSMTPMKVSGMPACLTTLSITPTRSSELTAVTTVHAAMRPTAHHAEMLADSSSSASSSSLMPRSAGSSEERPRADAGPFSSRDSVLECVNSWKVKKATYVDMTIHAPILDTVTTFAWSVVKVSNIVGRAKDMQEKSSMATLMSALFVANFCSFSRPMILPGVPWNECPLPLRVALGVRPPMTKEQPRTRRMLDSTEPSSENFTTDR
mmetsp:Transcript_57017/g.176901  ORF Transcript_57017/g.176901 Transcript_57017/m.176901 type:complete len:234 (+) Transcript_57017:324-1025(+)